MPFKTEPPKYLSWLFVKSFNTNPLLAIFDGAKIWLKGRAAFVASNCVGEAGWYWNIRLLKSRIRISVEPPVLKVCLFLLRVNGMVRLPLAP